MQRKFAFIASLFLLLSLTSCGIGSNQGKEDQPFTTDVHSGSDGLKIDFETDLPPSEIFYSPSGGANRGIIPIVLQIQNKGASPVGDATLFLDGYDPNLIVIHQWPGQGERLDRLEERSNANPEGGTLPLELTGDVVDSQWPTGLDSYDMRLKATLCYKYSTDATPVVCIDPKPFRKTEDKPCLVSSVPLAGGQGGPISVTNIDEQGTEDFVNFEISVGNPGGGVVFDDRIGDCISGSQDCCPYNIKLNDLNVVAYSVSLSGHPLDCKPESGRVRLVDGTGRIFCTYTVPTGSESAYKAPLEVILDYGYKSWTEREVKIKFAGAFTRNS